MVSKCPENAVVGIAALCIGAFAQASEFSGSVTATSEYIYRGQAASDGSPALQLGLDYEHDNGLFGGLWASTIDLESRYSDRDRELDVYFGYHYGPPGRFALTGTLMRYTYPGQRGINYNYSEAMAAITMDGRHSLEFGFTRNLYGLGRIGRHWELRSEWPLANAWVLSSGLGQNDLTSYGGRRYLYWDVGASARVARLTVDLRWYDNRPTGAGIGGTSAGSRLVLSLSGVF